MSTDVARVANGVAHFDIAGPDPERLEQFYREVFGWEITSQGPGYSLVRTPEGSANGAVTEAESASLIIGIVVSDLDRALANASASGGTITMEATDNGWVTKAQIADPAGNRVTLIQG
jgi:predicted enzyme related to lactoylglutathione lyase